MQRFSRFVLDYKLKKIQENYKFCISINSATIDHNNIQCRYGQYYKVIQRVCQLNNLLYLHENVLKYKIPSREMI